MLFSLRVKLTFFYLAILFALFVLFGSLIYSYIARSLRSTIDDALRYQIEKVEMMRAALANGADISEMMAARGENEEPFLQVSPGVMQIIGEEGQVADQTPENLPVQIPIDLDYLRNLEIGKTDFMTERLPNGEELRLATRRVQGHIETEGSYYIRLGQSLSAMQIARKRLLVMLIFAIPVALLLGSAGGLVLANQALRPVDRITRTAERIGAGDLTERVPVPAVMDEIGRLAATFNQMISRLQAAFERQKQFTSDASHELRTPLAVMRGDIEITLRRERTSEEYKRALTSNLEEIVRLSRLVEDLLMLARADSGRVELRLEPVDLNMLCQQMVEYITPLAQQREQNLQYEPQMEPDRQVVINADLHRIKQLFLNLLDNAIKYTDLKGVITLGLKIEDKQAVITVSDTGRGIPPEDVPHIFERFFRRSAPTSDRSAPGSGLGLSIVKWIVESHKGRIDASSVVGKGTTFSVRFPLLSS
jgi:heavy metal sensor kinase